MIVIQIVLILGFLYLLFKLLGNPNSYQIHAWTKIFGILLTVGAIMAVLFPESSNTVARWVGVTRGADLLLYLLTLAFIFVSLNSYIKAKQDQKRIVSLARKIAIIETQLRNKESK